MSSTPDQNDSTTLPADVSCSPPEARVESDAAVSSRFATRFWWLTLACVGFSVWLFWYERQRSGPLIRLQFEDGYGLRPDDRLRYRGVDVGEVERIELNPERTGVLVHVRLTPDAKTLAAEGSKFWIVRPVFSLDAIQGLDTLIGAKYVAVEPGPANAKSQNHFAGLDKSPILVPSAGSLEIMLDAKTRGGLENGAPILFRGFAIGTVVQVGLASDARTVRARCAIDPEYRELVREKSQFWNRSGWRLDVGLSGIKLDADTLSQIVSGGIEMATPPDGSSIVSTGYRFVLHDTVKPEWLEWQSSLPFGEAWNQLQAKMPQPIRIALRWQERRFGFRNNQQKAAWCLPLSDGSIMCFREQIEAPETALAGSVVIEFAGLSVSPDQILLDSDVEPVADSDVDKANDGGSGMVVRFRCKSATPPDFLTWPADRISRSLPKELSGVYITHSDAASVLSIDSARLVQDSRGWRIDESVGLNADQNGSPVVSAQTGQIIGLSEVKDSVGTIIAIP